MKIKEGFIIREVGGEHIVVPIGEAGKNFHGMVKLNESGAFLWRFFCAEHTQEEAVKALTEEYDVDEETAKKDVAAFAATLDDPRFIEKK
ncbi:MAG: PqqD family protein [Candidatus Scatosoma sp.]